MSYYFYTETAFHHEGDVGYLKDLIDASARVGAKGIKFQVLINYDELISTKHPGYSSFRKALISKEHWIEIFDYCAHKRLEIIYMPCDVQAITLIIENEVKPAFIDIHSVSFYDTAVLQLIKSTRIPVILGIGGRYPNEVAEKVEFFANQLKVLMVGYQSFPTALENLILEKIQFYKSRHPHLQIGYADHSPVGSEDSIVSNEWAYLLGARYFEKHITLRPHLEMFDWQSASSEEDIHKIINRLTRLDSKVLNKTIDEIQGLNGFEMAYRSREKVGLALRPLAPGTVLSEEHLVFKMAGVPGGLGRASEIIGKTLRVKKEADEVIFQDDLS